MELLTTRRELVDARHAAARHGWSLGLVPTLGALHDGHRSLIAAARERDDTVALSIFVNPLQFTDARDFRDYPRDLQRDLEIARGDGVDLVFAPAVDELYEAGDPLVTVDPGPLGEGLEGSVRPGHFRGVATVVAKLFALAAPDHAYFGEKDYEQLLLVRRMTRDLSFPIEIVGCPTLREADGLARSSRNLLLDDASRAAAPVLHRALVEGQRLIEGGESAVEVERAMATVVAGEPLASLDYAAVRDAASFAEPDADTTALRLLIAARFGPVRLIDNLGAERGEQAASQQ